MPVDNNHLHIQIGDTSPLSKMLSYIELQWRHHDACNGSLGIAPSSYMRRPFHRDLWWAS